MAEEEQRRTGPGTEGEAAPGGWKGFDDRIETLVAGQDEQSGPSDRVPAPPEPSPSLHRPPQIQQEGEDPWANPEFETASDEPEVEFDPNYRLPLEGLAYLGRLQGQFDFAGHRFVVKSLTNGEKLEALEIAGRYQGGGELAYVRAYRTAWAAAGLLSVDGEPIPVAMRTASALSQRFEYLGRTWYDPVVDAVFQKIQELEAQVIEVFQRLGALPIERGEQAVDLGGEEPGA